MPIYRVSYRIDHPEHFPDIHFRRILEGIDQKDTHPIDDNERLVYFEGANEKLQEKILCNFDEICPKTIDGDYFCLLDYCISEVSKENFVVCEIDNDKRLKTIAWLEKYWGVLHTRCIRSS